MVNDEMYWELQTTKENLERQIQRLETDLDELRESTKYSLQELREGFTELNDRVRDLGVRT